MMVSMMAVHVEYSLQLFDWLRLRGRLAAQNPLFIGWISRFCQGEKKKIARSSS